MKWMSYTMNKNDQLSVGTRMLSRFAFFVFLFLVIVTAMPAIAAAEEPAQKDGWQFGANIYMWMPTIGGKSTNGDTIEINFDDILKDLEFFYMGGFEARNGRWHLTTDVIYMKLKQENNGKVTVPVGPGEVAFDVDATVKLQAWIVTPAVGYTFIDTEKVRMEVLAGARYLWLKPELELDVTGPLHERDRHISDSGDVWDGIVGIRGNVNLDKNWYIPYYVDIGTGDSNLTWQWMAGFGCKVSKVVDVVAAWRYIYWRFDDNKVLSHLYINGPLVGVKFRF
jgi:opacity protein-like surface antigen